MTVTPKPALPRYVPAPRTTADLEYADLTVIDLSKVNTTEGFAELATQARDGMREQGFIYVINHGLTQEQNDRIFDIADIPFTQVGEEEKKRYAGKIREEGSYQGYKLRQFWHIDSGVRDQIEHYNINKNVAQKGHPEALRPFLPEISEFMKYNHFNILYPLLRLLAVGLELPEDTFVKQHGFDVKGETWARFMKYYPLSEEDEEKTKNVWLKGHTDQGSLTLLWSQPVAALQIMSPDGKWRWVKHVDNALVINAGDALEFLSGGYYRATIHRVIKPPQDQRGYPRLGVFYFTMPDDDVKLVPFEQESQVLQKIGAQRRFTDEEAPTMESWRRARTAQYGDKVLKKLADGTEEDYIGGIAVKHYN